MSLHASISGKKQPGVSDAVLLQGDGQKQDLVTEDAFLKNLESRFKEDVIYTYIGDVVVSVNPFKQLAGMYGQEAVAKYRGRYYYEVPPHLFAMTDDAYRDMIAKNRDQCIIISGESGAGKTEASKMIMQYIASVSSSSKDVDRVKDVLLKSNPILEAFGNAKTNRNNNSSRFGKYMDIQFNFKGDPVGGHINNYLLEKSRVIHQAKGERSFHIMYQLVESGLAELKLDSKPESYAYLKQSGCTKVNGINDSSDFKQVQSALKVVGFTADEIQSVFRMVAGILHLGNVEFAADEGNADVASVKSGKGLDLAAAVFKTTSDGLKDALLSRTVVTRTDSVKTPQNIEQAAYARDALSKALYFRLFDYIVSKINSTIKYENETQEPSKVIGVLDIYGFEVFETGNSFEQFCINYCNEKLQQLFISLTLKQEQEEYAREGIEWVHIEYFNNAIILDLIENTKQGIIVTLDEECMRPGATSDRSFLEKLDQRNSGSAKIDASAHYDSKALSRSDKTISDEQFRLKHYAGNVTYDIKGFMDKNMDNLSRDLKSLLFNSKDKVVASLFPDGSVNQESTKRLVSTSSTFKTSLNELVNILLSKTPHYVRCVKSNGQQSPGSFDMELCRHQTRYLGLLENVRVRRAGFVFRHVYEKFLDRYRVLCPKVWPTYRGTAREAVDVLLKHVQVSNEGYRLGKTKVFIRKPNTLFMMEEAREKALPRCATLIQKIYRGFKSRKNYRLLRSAHRIILFYRLFKFRKFFLTLHKTFQNVSKLADLGKSISWPVPKSKALVLGSSLMHSVWRNWRALQIIRKIPQDQLGKYRQKIQAHTLFHGKKPVNLNRPFLGEYLNKDPSPFKVKYEAWKVKLAKTNPGETVLFSDIVQKSSRNGKGDLRLLIITSANIHLLHPDFSTKKGARPLSAISKISATTGKDQLLVLTMSDEKGADYILDLKPGAIAGEKISELGVVLTGYFKATLKKQLALELISTAGIDAKTAKGATKVLVEKGASQVNGNALFKPGKNSIKAIYADV